jgi:hypothetical protein
MGSDSTDKKKKLYLSPTLTKLTPEQANKLVSERSRRNDHEPTEFLELLRQERPQNEKKHPLHDREGKNPRRSA